MGCVQFVSLAVLINCAPSIFFHASYGLGKGFPLSPNFMFLLIVESISVLVKDLKRRGDLKGVNISPLEVITHLLFINVVLLFCARYPKHFLELKIILDLYCLVTGTKFNLSKSNLLYNAMFVEFLGALYLALPFLR